MNQFSNPPVPAPPMTVHTIHHPIPPNVAAAIVQVMTGMPKLARDEKNPHGGYSFASIDDFLEAVRPLCASAGLIILQDEVEHEVVDGGAGRDGKPRRWLRVTYGFTLAHSSGETWEHRPSRSVVVDAAMGAQAFGAAQSYCLKLFMRSLFMISTGEKGQDVDQHPPNPLPGQEDKKAAFIASCHKIISSHTDIGKLGDWWNSEAEKALRRRHELTRPEVEELVAAVMHRRDGIKALDEQSAPNGKPKGPPRPRADVPPAPTADDDADPEAEAQDIIQRLDSLHDEETIKNLMEDYKVWERLEVGVFNRQHTQAIETAFRAAIERAQPEDDGPPAPPMAR